MTFQSRTEARVRQLAELALTETSLDPLVEQVCRLASTLFDVPMAYLSLIDATHQHLVGRHGFDLACTTREDAICNITIRRDEALVIEDTFEDPRVSDNPLVRGTPNIRFYAGVPLALTPGVPLGSFCIADRRPRRLSATDLAQLEQLAALVVGQIGHHKSRIDLARQTVVLAQQAAILQQTERFAGVGGFQADPKSGAMRWSDEMHRLYGRDADDAPTLRSFLASFEGDGKAALREAFDTLALSGTPVDLETRLRTGRGAAREVYVHAERRLPAPGGHEIVGIVQDITDRKAAHDRLDWIAGHDGLTRICNRARFTEHLEDAVRCADLHGHKVALFVLDIDRFKTINDTLGHDAGDAVLCAVAARLETAVGRRGLVARIGGDEFAVLIWRFETEGVVAALARDILAHLREPLLYDGCALSTRATFGVAFYEFDASPASALFKAADIALYNAKSAGRDGFSFYRRSMRDEVEARRTRLAEVRDAVMAGRIEPYYQPKICLSSGRILGFEALLRWHHPTEGLRAPGEMSDAFADREVATAIGHGMQTRVAADLAAWRTKGLTVGPVALNASEPEFHFGDYTERLVAALAAHGLPRNAIEIEVTESVLLGGRAGVVGVALGRLAEAGISIALDDFGTGFASLTHLKQFPVSTIKIDRSFVTDLADRESDATIVEAVISLGRALRLAVVAEGVETAAHLAFLRARGCTAGQGYLFAKPMAASRVPHFLRTWRGLPRIGSADERPRSRRRIAG